MAVSAALQAAAEGAPGSYRGTCLTASCQKQNGKSVDAVLVLP